MVVVPTPRRTRSTVRSVVTRSPVMALLLLACYYYVATITTTQVITTTHAWVITTPLTTTTTTRASSSRRPRPAATLCWSAAKAGTFFNPVPPHNNNNNNSNNPIPKKNAQQPLAADVSFEASVEDLLRRRKAPPRASMPSTIQGVPTAALHNNNNHKGLNHQTTKQQSPVTPSHTDNNHNNNNQNKPLIGSSRIGSINNNKSTRRNDITNPAVDDQGYTLYANEETGQTARVFEALVEYPCLFTLKIVGLNQGYFVSEMVALVAQACHHDHEREGAIVHSVRSVGKWTAVTVQAPVQSAEMLYQLYEHVDRDPRVKFKF